jgi:hypothetical protein
LEEKIAANETEIFSLLKNLVESPLYDLIIINLNQIKDIFNHLAARLDSWRDIYKADKVRLAQQTDQSEV